jgi:ABC-type multidrug transport system fused ATPase/permease subunit
MAGRPATGVSSARSAIGSTVASTYPRSANSSLAAACRRGMLGKITRKWWGPPSLRPVRSGRRSRNIAEEELVVVADVSFIDIFWSMLWFFFLFIWIVILFHVLTDLFRDHTLSGGMKTLWVVFLVFLPFLAVLVYVISRGKGMAERAAARQQQSQEQFEGYVRSVAATGDGTTTPADQIAQAKQLLDAGTIDQAEFDRLKAKALA